MKLFSVILVTGFAIASCNSNSNDSAAVTPDSSMNAVADNTAAQLDTTLTGNAIPGSANSGNMNDTINKNRADSSAVKKSGVTRKAKVTIVLPKLNSKMEMDKDGYYGNADVLPAYPGGQRALENFFTNNVEYPQQATDNGTEGSVDISFLVDENGKISSPKVIGPKVGDGIEEEALRVFNKMPSWKPGQIKGKNVKTRFMLPVRFQLEQ
jgi:periplasmic protein TonB